MVEDAKTEFKREYLDDIKYAIIAFLNTEGGKVYVGINDDGSIYGIADVDETMLRLSNLIRGSIRPDPSMFVKLTPQFMDGKNVMEIQVQRGVSLPYYLAGKGVRPEGVYVRLGAASVPASDSAILAMIRETSGDAYEDARSLDQDLTFDYASACFSKKNLAFGPEQHRTLGIVGSDGVYTNLGFLLSDQCGQTVKIAVFQDDDKMVFRDRREFSGSLLKQFDDACTFIQRHNRVHAEFKGMYRIDNFDYPLEALREALLNALVHRDYSLSASTLIGIFDNRLEFVNVGGLVRGISYEDILLGVSVLRNPRLANVFYRLDLIEAYGTGVMKINKCYVAFSEKPRIQVSNNAFKITLPNMNATQKEIPASATVSPREEHVISLLREKGRATRAEIQAVLNVSQPTTISLLRKMKESGLIATQGQGRMIVYALP